MIIILEPDSNETVVSAVMQQVSQIKELTAKKHVIQGEHHSVTEIYLIGPTPTIPTPSATRVLVDTAPPTAELIASGS